MKLFIGGLDWSTSQDAMREAFQRFGDIREAVLVLDRETGRSRGFGFITFSSPGDARSAMDQMNGSMLDGRALVVNEAREREPRDAGRPQGRRY